MLGIAVNLKGGPYTDKLAQIRIIFGAGLMENAGGNRRSYPKLKRD